MLRPLQVTRTLLKSGTKLESSLVLVGVGARPNVDLFKGQLALLERAPGGIEVNGRLQVCLLGTRGAVVGGGALLQMLSACMPFCAGGRGAVRWGGAGGMARGGWDGASTVWREQEHRYLVVEGQSLYPIETLPQRTCGASLYSSKAQRLMRVSPYPSQTSNPDVYAAGDVVAFPLKLTGAVTRQEHVTNCR